MVLAWALVAQPALAEGDAGRGAAMAYSCLGCHAIEGYRNADPSYRVPKLRGQKASYLVIALKAYRDGMRGHPTMTATLSDDEVTLLARYFSRLEGLETTPVE